ncbi:MAG: hypothetical protein AB7P40_23675, partial [Chloroflexota bacterium]
MAVGQQGRAEARRSSEATALARQPRAGDGPSRRVEAGGPAFISDEAEEQYHLDQLRDPMAEPLVRSMSRIELARMYERRGQFGEAAEMYERNIWDGVRTPATYAGLASAYRQLGRTDLADATLEQIRRQGGAQADPPSPDSSIRDAASQATSVLPTSRPRRSPSATSQRAQRMQGLQSRPRSASAVAAAPTRRQPAVARPDAASIPQQVRDALAPLLASEVGRRAVIASSVLLPVAIGVGIFVAVVMTSARSRTAEDAAAPAAAAPAATAVPTVAPAPAPTSAIPAVLADQPASATLVVTNVGQDGLTLRRSPGVGEKIRVWNGGTEMADLGDTAEHSGRTWRKVRDPQGNVGWAAADFLADPKTVAAGAPAGATNLSQVGPPYASGGLGLTRAEWEKVNGEPTRSSIFLEYAGGRLVVGLLEGNVWHLERVWPRADAVTLDAAREDARAYLVGDAVLVQSVDRGDGKIIDVYSSTSLTSRFGPTAWNGGRPGTFTIQYRFRTPADRMVTSAMFRLG